MTIDTLKVVITAETDKINKALSDTKKGLKDTAKQTKHSTSQMGKEFKNLGKKFAIAHLAVQLILKAIQALGKAMKAGIGNAYQFSKLTGGDLAKNLDSLKSSLTYLTNALGAVLTPILNAILPIVTQLIDKFADFANTVAEGVARLTGQDSFLKAKKTTEEYAESVEQSAEKVKKSTMGFDELNIVGDNNKEENNKTSVADMFEEVKIDKSNKLFDIPALFDKIKKSVSGAVKEVNKFFKDTDWKGLGKDIADVFNGIIDVIDTVFVETDWEEIGQSLMESLMSFIENIDWANLVHTLFDILIGALKLLKGLILGIDWNVLFDSLFEIFFSIIDELVNGSFLSDLMETAGVLVGKLIQGLITYWKKKIELFSQIITAIRDYFDGKIEECGGDVGKGILKGIGDALKNIGTWIYDKLIGPLLDGIADGLGLKGGRNAILSIFETAFTNVKIFFENTGIFFENIWGNVWYAIKKGAVDGINGVIEAINWLIYHITFGDTRRWLSQITGWDLGGDVRPLEKISFNEQAYTNKAYKEYEKFNIQTKSTVTSAGSASLPALNYKSGKAMNTVALMAEGGIVSRATNAIVGEDGREAIVPLERNTEWIDMLAEKINAGTPSRIQLNVDGKQLGYAVINNINNITKQTGSLQLSLA